MNVIFLDIDGVLNDANYFDEAIIENNIWFKSNLQNEKKFDLDYRLAMRKIDLDLSKIFLLKDLVNRTDAKIVFISSWINLRDFPLIEDYFLSLGFPVIGKIDFCGAERGLGIKKYLANHDVHDYVIIDDEIFASYDDELKYHLIHTDFYNGGLQEEHVYDATYLLRTR